MSSLTARWSDDSYAPEQSERGWWANPHALTLPCLAITSSWHWGQRQLHARPRRTPGSSAATRRPSDATANGIRAVLDMICSRAKLAEHEVGKLAKDNPVVVLAAPAAAAATSCFHDAARGHIEGMPDGNVTMGQGADPNGYAVDR